MCIPIVSSPVVKMSLARQKRGVLADLMGSLSQRFEVLDDNTRRSDYHSVVDHKSDYGSFSSYASSGYGDSGHKDCCELVVDPLTFFSLLAAIVGGTAFLNVVVTMVLGGRKRKKRSAVTTLSENFMDTIHAGRRLTPKEYWSLLAASYFSIGLNEHNHKPFR